jgi:hypothetical protein
MVRSPHPRPVAEFFCGSFVLASTSGHALASGPARVQRMPEAGERGTATHAAHREAHFWLAGRARGRRRDPRHAPRRCRLSVFHEVSAVVRWDASGIDSLRAGRHLALATCWPLDGRTPGPLRYLVHAEMRSESAAASDFLKQIVAAIACRPAGAGTFCSSFGWKSRSGDQDRLTSSLSVLLEDLPYFARACGRVSVGGHPDKRPDSRLRKEAGLLP